MPLVSPETLVPFRVVRPHAKVRLFCLPFAGGGASTYRTWPATLPPLIDVCPIELPGRGLRFGEPLMTVRAELVDRLVGELAPLFDRPIAFFGHSMGARIALDLARRCPAPVVHFFASASRAPHRERRRRLETASDERIVFHMRSWGATPEEVFTNKELMDIALPIVRADAALLEQPTPRRPPLACPIIAFVASRDGHEALHAAAAWRAYTTARFRLFPVRGGHVFVNEPAGKHLVLGAIARALTSTAASPAR